MGKGSVEDDNNDVFGSKDLGALLDDIFAIVLFGCFSAFWKYKEPF